MNRNCDVFSKPFAARVATFIDVGLISLERFHSWGDRQIENLDAPPIWLLELSTIKDSAQAVARLKLFIDSQPFGIIDLEVVADEYVASKFLLYQSGSIKWETFLSDSGAYTDGSSGRRNCEYFYCLLNEYEFTGFVADVESRQKGEVENEFADCITSLKSLLELFIQD